MHPLVYTWNGEAMTDQEERWAVCQSFPAYSVSDRGRVRRDAMIYGGGGSVRFPQGVLAQRALPLGHLQVTVSMNNTPRTVLVHRLVADAFLAPPLPGKDCVLHRDDNPANNRWDNLFWGTRRDNSDDKVSKSRQARGVAIGSAKLNENTVLAIREQLRIGERQRDIAVRFGVSQSNVSLIASRQTWGHIE